MSLELSYFNIWAVLLTIVVQMALGMLWYSPVLFGKIWLKLTEQKSDDISREEGNKAMGFAVIPAIVSSLTLALVLGFSGAAGVIDGLILASLSALGFSGMAMLNLVFFEDRSFKLTLLNAGYTFAGLNLGGLILTLWK